MFFSQRKKNAHLEYFQVVRLFFVPSFVSCFSFSVLQVGLIVINIGFTGLRRTEILVRKEIFFYVKPTVPKQCLSLFRIKKREFPFSFPRYSTKLVGFRAAF